MKMGILDCDILRQDLKTQYVSYGVMMQRMFEQIDNHVEHEIFNVKQGQYPEDINDCDAYLITGSKSSAYDDDEWIKNLTSYIQQ